MHSHSVPAHLSRLAVLMCLVAVFLAAVQPVSAQQAPVYTEPLGITLESYPYPHPVQFLPLSIEGQSVRMAYIDVPP